jgi:hypothetical protein
MTILSSYLTFAPISWWMKVLDADKVIFDTAEHFQKMSWRNRYRISGANKPLMLTVPISYGRSQRIPIKDVGIYNKDRWQVQHWRTLVSVYNRSPFFEHYETGLKPLFEAEFLGLADFNRAALHWAKQQLKLNFEEEETDVFIKKYPEDVTDIRIERDNADTPKYYQVFEDRIGFQPDLSILDLLFSEGPRAVEVLRG